MKYLAKIFLQYYLYFFAKLLLLRSRSLIIAVAGTTNKTFVKEEIEGLLGQKRAISLSSSYNTEIGLPLAILGLRSGYNSYERWLKTMIEAPIKALTGHLPKIAVFEFGSSQPGDLEYLLRIIKPRIAVVTGITQRYLEQFGGIDKAAQEYEVLVKAIPENGFVILNFDLPEVRALASVTRAKALFFSVQDNEAVLENQDQLWLLDSFRTTEKGIEGRLIHGDHVERFSSPRFGRHHAAAFVAARAVVEQTNKIKA